MMNYFFGLLDRTETEAMLGRIPDQHREHGFGNLAVEIRGVAEFAGFIGLGIPLYEASFTPGVEIG